MKPSLIDSRNPIQHIENLTYRSDAEDTSEEPWWSVLSQECALVFDMLPDMFCILGLDGRARMLNNAWQETLGFTREEIKARPLMDLVHPDDHQATLRARQQIREGQPLISFENRYRCRDGSYKWLLWNARADLEAGVIFAIARDVTASKASGEQLRLLESVVLNANDGVLITDADYEDGPHIVYVNEAFTRMTDYQPQEVLGKRPDLLLADGTTQKNMDAIREAMAAQRPISTELTTCDKSGEEFWMEVDLQPAFDEQGELTHWVVIQRDVTEKRQMTAKMMQMDRMISIGTLAAGVGHEINNPLSYVIVNIDFALDTFSEFQRMVDRYERMNETADRETSSLYPPLQRIRHLMREAYEALEEASEGAERIRSIVRDLRTFSRKDEQNHNPVHLPEVIELAISMAHNELRHRANLEVEIADDLPVVSGNQGRLGQVFLNLLINAAHAIPQGQARDHTIRVRAFADGDDIIGEVSDTGCGISDEIQEQLFDPFFTTKPPGRGTGLGLTICHEIVTDHGGEITIDSEEGVGTSVRVRLPIGAEAKEAVSPKR